jgi:hypothetical protein
MKDFPGPGLGVPGHPGTGAVGHAMAGQRRDLGTIPGQPPSHRVDSLQGVRGSEQSCYRHVESPYGGISNSNSDDAQHGSGMIMPRSESFVGSITGFFFGRKGGLL